MLQEYAEDNYYARFDTHSYHCCKSNTLECTLLTDGWTDKLMDGNFNSYFTHYLKQVWQKKRLEILWESSACLHVYLIWFLTPMTKFKKYLLQQLSVALQGLTCLVYPKSCLPYLPSIVKKHSEGVYIVIPTLYFTHLQVFGKLAQILA